jgi:pyruvate dehydrogenase E2 component (dihydrolipoyllysine-residue acetyltransferase)
MSKDVIMPQMGESLAEGTITKWLKKVGDKIERDEPLFEISTDKVDAEIPAPASGILSEIVAGEGQTVPVNEVVARITAAGEAAAPVAPKPSAPQAEAPRPAPVATTPPAAPVSAPARAPERSTATAVAPAPAAPVRAPGGDGQTKLEKPYGQYPVEEVRRVRSSPVVRKIAAEHGVDIADIPGHGVSGRVTKQDILEYIEAAPAPVAAPAPAPAMPAAAPAALPAFAPAGLPGGGLFIPDLRIPPYVEGEPVEIEPMSLMRRKIAEHMVYSMSVSAHVTSFFDVDFEAVARQRESMKRDLAEKGLKLTFMPFVVRAVVEGLKRYPYVNAAVMGDKIVFKKEINIGIAVALEDGKGLIVPVIRNADEKNLQGLARAINDLGERARTKKLLPEDVQRGTFSITNPGVFGGLMGTPIINQPQVAILGVGAIEKRPVVVNDAIAIRHRAYLSLSYDHRLVDGAMAEMFMASVKAFIEAGNVQ